MDAKTDTKTPQPRIVLVGACKGDQFKTWPGWYCLLLEKDDLKCCQCENVANSQSQLPMQRMEKLATGNNGNGNTSTMATLPGVTERGVFQWTKEAAA